MLEAILIFCIFINWLKVKYNEEFLADMLEMAREHGFMDEVFEILSLFVLIYFISLNIVICFDILICFVFIF